MCLKYRGKISDTNRSASRTVKASPLGSQETIEVSSFRNMSISLRGNGFDPELPPGELVDESVGEGATLLLDDEVLVIRRVDICPGTSASLVLTAGLVVAGGEATAALRLPLMIPAATEEPSGTTTGPSLAAAAAAVSPLAVLSPLLALSKSSPSDC